MKKIKSKYRFDNDKIKELEYKLKESNEKYKSLFENIPDTTVIIDLNNSILSINRPLQWVGEKDYNGKNIIDFFPASERERIMKINEEVFSTGKSLFFEFKETDTGQWFSLSIACNRKNGVISGAIMMIRNIPKINESGMEMEIGNDFSSDLIEKAHAIMLVLDTTGRIVRFNSYMKEISGYSLDEVKGNDWFSTFIPENERSTVKKIFKKVVTEDRQTKGNINSIIVKDGSKRQIEWYDKILKDPNGQIYGLLAFGIDVTERKQVEEALRASEARLTDAMKIAKIGYWEFDLNKQVYIFNDQFYALFRTTAEKVGGYRLSPEVYVNGFIHPDDRLAVKEGIKQAFVDSGDCNSTETEHRFFYADGETGHMAVRVFVNKDSIGNIIRIFGANQDITDWVKAEKALRTSEAQLSNAMKIAHLGHWEYDFDKDLFTFNDHFYSIFHTTADKVGGYTMTPDRYSELFIHPDDREVLAYEMQQAREATDSNFNRQLEHRIVYADGEIGYISVRYFVIKDKKDRTIKTYGANQDITERKRVEKKLKEQNEKYQALNEQLKESLEVVKYVNSELEIAKRKAEESDRLKSAFLANMSHEIRTPMNGIIGFSRLLNKPGITDERRKQYADIINDMCQQLLQLISDIIDISKIETGQLKINKIKTNVNDVLMGLVAHYQPIAQRNNLNMYLHKSLTDDQAVIMTDQAKFKKIIDNLISNSLKFTHKGYIRVGYQLINDFLEFFIEDTGIGIFPEMQNKIFERFTQAENNLSKIYGGAGLGLSISKAYVEKLGGEIRVSSVPGEGSVFHFTIPYDCMKKSKNLQKSEKDCADRHRPIVLVVEDEEINYIFFEEVLLELDIELIHAKSGIEAINNCRENPQIDLVLMDIKLPGLDGYDTVKQIKTFRADLPIIAQTAYALAGDREKALDAGCIDYIAKPINENELLEKVKYYITS